MSLLQGSTFINKPYSGQKPHLWIIISDPTFDSNSVVIVNVTTWRTKATIINDPSCVINKGEHPFVDKKSYIFYREAQVVPNSKIQDALSMGLLSPDEDCSPGLLEKILLGAAQSQHTSLKVLGVLQEQGLID